MVATGISDGSTSFFLTRWSSRSSGPSKTPSLTRYNIEKLSAISSQLSVRKERHEVWDWKFEPYKQPPPIPSSSVNSGSRTRACITLPRHHELLSWFPQQQHGLYAPLQP